MIPEAEKAKPAEAVPAAVGLPPALPPAPPTPGSWRLAIAGGLALLAAAAYLLDGPLGPRFRAGCGILFFCGLVALFSANLRAVNWRTIVWGVALQLFLAVLILKVGVVAEAFRGVGTVVDHFLKFSDKGAEFVFGNLARPDVLSPTVAPHVPPDEADNPRGFVFAFRALPPIIFVSAFFSVLYHFGVLQFVVRLFARVMMYLMRTSGAETLSVSANVFMGQTEAPLIVRPFVPRMTNSELFALMVSGMAHISGGLLAVYMGYVRSGGRDYGVGDVLITCIMACPCSLYLAKLLLPETAHPETLGDARIEVPRTTVNAIDAIASGTTAGLQLALNVAAMLISFIAFVYLFNALLGLISPGLTLQQVFGWVFSPVAFLMGVDAADAHRVGSLLGIKLALNEHVAYINLTKVAEYKDLSDRSFRLAVFALTGFANFASVGIQLGGIGALAPDRRHDLARLGGRALFVGFTATLVNASVAGVLLN
jgi:CNT family concentrative nucleoside transporter